MRNCRVLPVLLALLGAVPASAHEVWIEPATALVDASVWVNPGVYVSQFSGVHRNYPYVGCCLPARENWSLRRPYYEGWAMHAGRAAHVRVSQRRVAAEPPHMPDRLHYPDGRPIDRFR